MSDTPLRDQVLQTSAGETEPAFVPYAGTYASMRGTSRQTGKNWNDAGLIVWVADDAKPGKQLVDVAATDRRRADQQNPLKRHAPAPGSDTPQAPPAPQPAAPAASDDDLFTESPARRPLVQRDGDAGGGSADASAGAPSALQDTQQARASALKLDREWMQVRRTELKLREDMGELVRKTDSERIVFDALRRVRDTMRRVAMDACEAANPEAPHIARTAIEAEIDKKLARAAVEIELALRGEVAPEGFEADDEPEEPAEVPAGADPELVS
jgi:hypothetical protein